MTLISPICLHEMVFGFGQNLIFSIKYMSASCHTEISFTPVTVNWDIRDKVMKHYYIYIIWVIKSRIMRYGGQVAHMGGKVRCKEGNDGKT
jgi:hypothetical protein